MIWPGGLSIDREKEGGYDGNIMKKLLVDQDKCIGCGTCVALCPEVFELNNEGKAEVKSKVKSEKLKVKIQEAIEACPVEAISWQEEK